MLAVVQAVVIPKLGWPALRLLRFGAPISAVDYLILAPANQLWTIIVSMLLLAVGLGLSMPGYAAPQRLPCQPSNTAPSPEWSTPPTA